jgi:hypothetical protein
VAYTLVRAAPTLVSSLVREIMIASQKSVEMSLDAARTSAYATWLVPDKTLMLAEQTVEQHSSDDQSNCHIGSVTLGREREDREKHARNWGGY